MKVVTLLNEKGGVGKTTLSVTLASGLAAMGYRVMLVDTDPQGHAGLSLGMEKAPGFYDLVVRGADLGQVTKVVSPKRYAVPSDLQGDFKGKLYVIPGNIETRGIPMQVDDDLIVLRIMAQLEKANLVDFVVFDTSPTPSLIHKMLLVASDGVIYPTEANMLSMDGLSESIKHVKSANKERASQGLPQLKLFGIVPMRTRNTLEHAENLQDIEQAFGEAAVWDAMPVRTVWEECTRERLGIFAYAPHEPAAEDARIFLRSFLNSAGVKTNG
jgi:chromosome partitioning protein